MSETSSDAAEGVPSSSKRSYGSRIGFVADSPNFPGEWNKVVEKVKIADELGFDSIWLGESWGYELFTSMSDLLSATKRIKIGAGIANVYSRTPALVASTIATLDERSGGRAILGLGPSGANVVEHWHGVPFQKPIARTREYIEIIRMILHGEKLVHHGEFFNLERGFKLRFTPARADIPIYVAALGPKYLSMSGEIADGVLPVYWTATRWPELRAQLDEGSLLAGRPPHSTAIAPYITTILLPENASEQVRQQARLHAASPLAYYIGKMGVYYAQSLTRQGYGDEVQAVIEGWKQGMKTAIEITAERLIDVTAIIGSPREVVAKLDEWVALGVDEPILSMPAGTIDETATQLAALKAALQE